MDRMRQAGAGIIAWFMAMAAIIVVALVWHFMA